MDPNILKHLLMAQKNEATEHVVYARLAARMKDGKNRRVLERISKDERSHYLILRKYTGVEVAPNGFQVFLFSWISRLLGFTFAVKLMEAGEQRAQAAYDAIAKAVPALRRVMRDEDRHEREILAMLDEELLQYVSSIVLGINDALVELTGAMAGLTFALRNHKLVALAGIITGVAASLSMGASEYLSKRHEGGDQSPLKASLYTGTAYLLTVAWLVFPYLVHENHFVSLAWMMANAILVILFFTYYISVAKDQPFKSRFLEMAGLSMGVAVLSFGIGLLARHFLGVDAG